jgi:hypothetical protein
MINHTSVHELIKEGVNVWCSVESTEDVYVEAPNKHTAKIILLLGQLLYATPSVLNYISFDFLFLTSNLITHLIKKIDKIIIFVVCFINKNSSKMI